MWATIISVSCFELHIQFLLWLTSIAVIGVAVSELYLDGKTVKMYFSSLKYWRSVKDFGRGTPSRTFSCS